MKLVWDKTGERFFETGVKNGVLYPQNADGTYPLGVVWNGLVGVNESPSGAEATPLYADDTKYLNLMSAEEYAATVEAYTYPDEFSECNGDADIADGVSIGQQSRKTFGMCYKTTIGNDLNGELGYKLHLIYGGSAAPSEKSYQTINDSPEAVTFSWEVSTTPVTVTGKKPTASLTIDSTKADPTVLAALEDILFGTAGTDARLPLPDEIAALFAAGAPAALALSSIVPADDATAIPVASNIVLTFNNKILKESIVLSKNDGTIVDLTVAGVKSWDAAGKVLTINPASNLTSGVYLVTIVGVQDIYGQVLATSVKNFTTV